jgi:hypothetical protein
MTNPSFTLVVLQIGLAVAIIVALIRKYLRTRDVGFVWLGVAAVIWPFASGFLAASLRMLVQRGINGNPVAVYPLSLIGHGELTYGSVLAVFSMTRQVIATGLMLIAILYLHRLPRENRAVAEA